MVLHADPIPYAIALALSIVEIFFFSVSWRVLVNFLSIKLSVMKAYLFVCMLAYRLLAVLQWKLKEASGKEGSWESADMFLRDLAVVQRVEVRFGNEVKTWYLNMTDSVSARLKEIGMSALFKEETRLVG